jgi:hypothetical protein
VNVKSFEVVRLQKGYFLRAENDWSCLYWGALVLLYS